MIKPKQVKWGSCRKPRSTVSMFVSSLLFFANLGSVPFPAVLRFVASRGSKEGEAPARKGEEFDVTLTDNVVRLPVWICHIKPVKWMNSREQSSHRTHGSSSCVGGLGKHQSLPERAPIASTKGTIDQPSSRNKRKWSLTSEATEHNMNISHSLATNLSSAPNTVNESMRPPGEAPKNLFINKAAIAWNEMRREWVGDQSEISHTAPRKPTISWSTYEDLLSTSQPFPEPIPLSEMVDFLVDIWHEEGLYE